ncbi:MAG: hypothetical protein HN704_02365 [Bacteroidetes bacterium]|jgi:hypothetical protein|nr:hypothetical protein [Bacteroidota bacterium]MBT6686382.1 hypothetical protein [Bacteroidota bacterium]MBT7142215.1 hypothetical protein [Bacteroidota bacterium]MBT7490430.1 hypothetical protein [Bacteroidota bacterium]
MKKEKNTEKIFDLLEDYNFEDLAQADIEIVLQEMSVEEYKNLRSTIEDTKVLLDKKTKISLKLKKPKFHKILNYRMEAYKVAATILIIFGIAYIFSLSQNPEKQNIMALVDTVFVEITDTIFSEVKDTVVIIKEKIIYKNEPKNQLAYVTVPSKKPDYNPDCNIKLCASDIEILSELKTKNDIVTDSSLRDFLVMLETTH